MSKATDKGGAAKPRAARGKPGAAAVQDPGASAPVSAGAAGTSTTSTIAPEPVAPAVTAPEFTGSAEAPVADAVVVLEEPVRQSLGMGRFPPDWVPTPTTKAVDDSENPAQTLAIEGSEEPAKSSAWGLPDVTEFPAKLTLDNKTPARVRVLAVRAWVLPFSSMSVQCDSPEQYQALCRDLSARARSCGWDSVNCLQVKYEQD